MSGEYKYRANAAALILDQEGSLLICERLKQKGAWQFPQGGVDVGESVKKALKREVYEEVGFKKSQYKIIEKRGGYQYLYSPKVRERKLKTHGHHGQEQTYFLCQMKEVAPMPDLSGPPIEFRGYRWIDPSEFKLKWVPDFKKKTYQKVFRDFFNIKLT